MENQQLSKVNSKDLVIGGHKLAKAMGNDYVAELATRLDCALVRGDAHKQDVITWEKAMMEAIGEDGVGCVVKAINSLKAERDALQQKLEETEALMYAMRHDMRESREKMEAMLAENLALKNYIDGECYIESKRTGVYTCAGINKPETPATDAILSEVRADGVEMFAKKCSENSKQATSDVLRDSWWVSGEHADDFAYQLRTGSTEGGV